jgi:hypothetical protein
VNALNYNENSREEGATTFPFQELISVGDEIELVVSYDQKAEKGFFKPVFVEEDPMADKRHAKRFFPINEKTRKGLWLMGGEHWLARVTEIYIPEIDAFLRDEFEKHVSKIYLEVTPIKCLTEAPATTNAANCNQENLEPKVEATKCGPPVEPPQEPLIKTREVIYRGNETGQILFLVDETSCGDKVISRSKREERTFSDHLEKLRKELGRALTKNIKPNKYFKNFPVFPEELSGESQTK